MIALREFNLAADACFPFNDGKFLLLAPFLAALIVSADSRAGEARRLSPSFQSPSSSSA
jgi:hypothetical protein